MKVLQGALAFFLELAALAALGYWGFRTGTGVWRWLLGLGAPAVMIVLWSLFLAAGGTNARFATPRTAQFALKIVIYGAAFTALYAAGPRALAVVLGALAVVSLVVDAITPLHEHEG